MKRNSHFLKLLFVPLVWGAVACNSGVGEGEIRQVEKRSEKAYGVEIPLLDTTEVTIVTN